MGATDITSRIQDMISSFDPSIEAEAAVSSFRGTIQRLETDYRDLIILSQQRERYNPSWAFSHAHAKLKHELSHIFTRRVKDQILKQAGTHRNRDRQDVILKKFSVIEENLTVKIQKAGTYSKAFRTTAFLISSAELLLSLSIVILVTQLSQLFSSAVTISLPQLSIIFIGVFGLMRLLLEKGKSRFLNSWRWNMYVDTIDTAYHGLVIMMATTCLLAYYMKRGTFLEDIDDLLEKSLDELSRKVTREERKRRKAAHLVARKRMETTERISLLTQRLDTETVHSIMGLDVQEEPVEKKPLPSYRELFGRLRKQFSRK